MLLLWNCHYVTTHRRDLVFVEWMTTPQGHHSSQVAHLAHVTCTQAPLWETTCVGTVEALQEGLSFQSRSRGQPH